MRDESHIPCHAVTLLQCRLIEGDCTSGRLSRYRRSHRRRISVPLAQILSQCGSYRTVVPRYDTSFNRHGMQSAPACARPPYKPIHYQSGIVVATPTARGFGPLRIIRGAPSVSYIGEHCETLHRYFVALVYCYRFRCRKQQGAEFAIHPGGVKPGKYLRH